MALSNVEKAAVLKQYGQGAKDTGSPEVQVALLTANIEKLQSHFEAHKQDHHSRRGLLMLVARRRRLLDYLKSRSPERYVKIIQSLGIRR